MSAKPYSYSKLKTWSSCPRKFDALYVSKTHTQPITAALTQGTEVHKKLEDALKTDAPAPPPGLKVPEKFWKLLRKLETTVEVPMAYSLRHDSNCKWEDSTAILRGKIDVEAVWGTPGNYKTMLVDWKTGNPTYMADELQAKVYGLFFAHTPGSMVRGRDNIIFCWQNPIYGTHKLQKINCEEAKREVLTLIDVVDKTTNYNPKPGPLCPWCPVVECEYFKRRR